jgi:lipopolysaccharide biosynthesis glycosyltransferase
VSGVSTIHVVNAADAAYVPHTAAMLHSLFERNPGESFHVHFLHRIGLDEALLQRLAALCHRHGAAFTATPVARERLSGLPIGGIFTEEAWYRVVLAELLPQVARALWLDADVIVLQPIRELWELDLEGRPLAACPNAVMYSFRDVIRNIGVTDRSLYFNSGVLLMDLEQLRAEGAGTALRAAADQARRWLMFADQDVLNIVYHRRYKRLPLAWNVLSQSYINVPETLRVHGRAEYKEAMARPRIVHFTGMPWYKPWSHTCAHPYRGHYLRHRAAAGWPPPDFPEPGLRALIKRQVPLRLREILISLRARRYAEMLSYLRQW